MEEEDLLPGGDTPINTPQTNAQRIFEETLAKYDGKDNNKGIGGSGRLYIGTDIGESKYDKDLRPDAQLDPMDYVKSLQEYRARQQPVTHQISRGAAKLLPNIILGTVGNLASMLDFEDYNNSDQEVGNWLTTLTEQGKEYMNDTMKIYRENPNEHFDFSDSGWWVDNMFGLAESMGSFAISGGILGKTLTGLSKLAKTQKLAAAITGSTNVAEIAGGTFNTVVTAAALNQAEGILEASDVMKQTYQYHISRGQSEEYAKKAAAHAGATTVNTNRVNVFLNLSSASLFFRGSRLTNRVFTNPSMQKNFGRGLAEGGQESIEEVINLVSSKRGLAYGKGHDYTFNDVVNDIASEEALEAAVLGFVGGMGQTILTTEGVNRFRKTGDPDSPGEMISIKEYNRKQYNKYRDEIDKYNELAEASDVTPITDTFKSVADRTKIAQAIAEAEEAGEYDKVEDLQKLSVATMALDAFRKGTTKPLINLFRSYAAGPQREGMGEDYKERAEEAVRLIKKLENEYVKSYDNHGSAIIYQNRAARLIRKEKLDATKAELATAEAELFEEVSRQTEGTGFDPRDRGTYFFENADNKDDVFLGLQKKIKDTEAYARVQSLKGRINDINNSINDLDEKHKFLTKKENQEEFGRVKDQVQKEREEAAKKERESKKEAEKKAKAKEKEEKKKAKEAAKEAKKKKQRKGELEVLDEISEEVEEAANEQQEAAQEAATELAQEAAIAENEEKEVAENLEEEEENKTEFAKLFNHRSLGDKVPVPKVVGPEYEGLSGTITSIDVENETISLELQDGSIVEVTSESADVLVFSIIPYLPESDFSTEGGNNLQLPEQGKEDPDENTLSGPDPKGGAKVISRYDDGTPLEWVEGNEEMEGLYPEILDYEREPVDKKGQEVKFNIVKGFTRTVGLSPERREALNIYTEKLTGNKRKPLGLTKDGRSEIEILYRHLPLLVEFSDSVEGPIEAEPNYAHLTQGTKAIQNFEQHVLPLRKAIIDALVSGKSFDDITGRVQDQFKGVLQVAPKDENDNVVENNVMELDSIRGDFNKIELLMVNDYHDLQDAYGQTRAANIAGKGEIYIEIPMANGQPFHLKLNIRRLNNSETEILFLLYKAMLNSKDLAQTTRIKDLDNKTFTYIKNSFAQQLEVIRKSGKVLEDVTIKDIVDFLIWDGTDNKKTRVQLSKGRLFLGDGIILTAKNLDEKKAEFTQFFQEVKRHHVKFKKKKNDTVSLTAQNDDYMKYLFESGVINTNAVVNEPTFQGRTHIYIEKEISIKGEKPQPTPKQVAKKKQESSPVGKGQMSAEEALRVASNKYQNEIKALRDKLTKEGKPIVAAIRESQAAFKEKIAAEQARLLGVVTEPSTKEKPVVSKPVTKAVKKEKPVVKGIEVTIKKDAKSNWNLQVMENGDVVNTNTGKVIDDEKLINKAHLKSDFVRYEIIEIKTGKTTQSYAVTNDHRIINVTKGSKANGNSINPESGYGQKVLSKFNESMFDDTEEAEAKPPVIEDTSTKTDTVSAEEVEIADTIRGRIMQASNDAKNDRDTDPNSPLKGMTDAEIDSLFESELSTINLLIDKMKEKGVSNEKIANTVSSRISNSKVLRFTKGGTNGMADTIAILSKGGFKSSKEIRAAYAEEKAESSRISDEKDVSLPTPKKEYNIGGLTKRGRRRAAKSEGESEQTKKEADKAEKENKDNTSCKKKK